MFGFKKKISPKGIKAMGQIKELMGTFRMDKNQATTAFKAGRK